MIRNPFFPEIKGNFGFGCMRPPMKGNEVDLELFARMADRFLEAGFNYFDTAHGYTGGKSETAIRDCVCSRHPRDSFLLTNKLTAPYFRSREDIRPFFEKQLSRCGVDYFDFYLMHSQDASVYPKFVECKAYEEAWKLKEEGLIRHVGLSFHDKASVLDRILNDHPEVEAVQIQLNYLDFDDSSVEAGKVYEVCEKHGKPVLVMEPVKGGCLVNLPEKADAVLRSLNGGSNASYALRFAGSFPKVACILSGMSNLEQMEDNIRTMQDFRPLDEKEFKAVRRVCALFRELDVIPCTGCRYCIEENECPKSIRIPDVFAAMNALEAFHDWNAEMYYSICTQNGRGKASDCIQCGKCEKVCPQHLEIRSLLKSVSAAFES